MYGLTYDFHLISELPFPRSFFPEIVVFRSKILMVSKIFIENLKPSTIFVSKMVVTGEIM